MKYILLMCIWWIIALYTYLSLLDSFLSLHSDNYLNCRLHHDDTELFYMWPLISWRRN